ncbi:MAG TPA: sulfotransferase [Acetobacteraceae bacterium]|jgi:hypothetical protein|nr:sulfotransferase [Acetobacteraceae bacterium]
MQVKALGPDQVFILGSPRSGTSALLHALKTVFGLQGKEEGQTLPVFTGILQIFHGHSARFKGQPYLLASCLDTDHFRRHILEYIRILYRDAHAGAGFVDKTPGAEAIVTAGLIKEAFPASRILMLRRNGIDYARSFSKKFNVDIEAAARSWVICMRALEIARETCGDFLEIDHSELLHDRENTSGLIADYLGHPERREALATRLARTHIEVTSVSEAGCRERSSRLSDVPWDESEKRQFRNICGPFMEKFGYEL